jgi:hypothetical protein
MFDGVLGERPNGSGRASGREGSRCHGSRGEVVMRNEESENWATSKVRANMTAVYFQNRFQTGVHGTFEYLQTIDIVHDIPGHDWCVGCSGIIRDLGRPLGSEGSDLCRGGFRQQTEIIQHCRRRRCVRLTLFISGLVQVAQAEPFVCNCFGGFQPQSVV